MRGQFGDADITNAVAEILMDFQLDNDWTTRMFEAMDEILYSYMATYTDRGDCHNVRRLRNMQLMAELRAKLVELVSPPDLYEEENDDLVFDIPAGYGRPDPEPESEEPEKPEPAEEPEGPAEEENDNNK